MYYLWKSLDLSLLCRVLLVKILFFTEAVFNSSLLIHSNTNIPPIIKFSRIKFPVEMTISQSEICYFITLVLQLKERQNICEGWEVGEKRAIGMLRGLRKVQSQRRCIGWRFEMRRRCRHRRRVLCVARGERGTLSDFAVASCFPSSPRPYSCHPRHPPLSGLSTVAIPAVFRWGPSHARPLR